MTDAIQQLEQAIEKKRDELKMLLFARDAYTHAADATALPVIDGARREKIAKLAAAREVAPPKGKKRARLPGTRRVFSIEKKREIVSAYEEADTMEGRRAVALKYKIGNLALIQKWAKKLPPLGETNGRNSDPGAWVDPGPVHGSDADITSESM